MYLTFAFITTLVTLFLDLYYYRAFKDFLFSKLSKYWFWLKSIYWLTTFFIIAFWLYNSYCYANHLMLTPFEKTYVAGIILIITISKIIGCLFILLHDILSIPRLFRKKKSQTSYSRRNFLKKTAVVASAIPFGTLMFGVLKSAFDFNIMYQKLSIPGLPKSFHKMKIVQISDIHSGSFISEKPLMDAVKMIMEQKPDMVFFTGDLVNDITEEVLPYRDILKKITAPLGVFSILGNHDYGDYFYQKEDLEGKRHNYELMKKVHEELGWNLLLNENRIVTKNNERLAILGVENWGGSARFPKLGNIEKAKEGCLDDDIKLLLSHDPSHWEEVILPKHKDISVTFSGHTHGMQFGIEIPGFKWSPSKYLYKFWAGLYKSGNQQIYVNRGLGFLGYPGRVGILPEITVFTLS